MTQLELRAIGIAGRGLFAVDLKTAAIWGHRE
jgi:hypothetical protein